MGHGDAVEYTLLHCADLHLDSPLRGLEADHDAPAAAIRGATRQALTNLVDFAINRGVAAVLIAGDLYDGEWQDWRTGQFLVAALTRLTQAGIRVVAISGNHDAESIITRKLRWPDGATMLPSKRADTVTIPALNLHIHGRSFATRDTLDNLLPSYPARIEGGLNIGLLHLSHRAAWPRAVCPVHAGSDGRFGLRVLGVGPYPYARDTQRGSLDRFSGQSAGPAYP
jgi:predicted MPP superfamily phosphohydrolase